MTLTGVRPLYPSSHRSSSSDVRSDVMERKDRHLDDAQRCRPSYHITAPRGWLNDPCGLGYDPTAGLYHLSFQWNPKGNDWGNISWGHGVSKDLLAWEIFPEPCLEPTTAYDHCGIFTGCLRPTAVNGAPHTLTVVYTSVKRLPIHYTLPYVPGSESVSMATSQDQGLTWQRLDCNPVLLRPPETVTVTGWRDPFIGRWQFMLQQPGAFQSSDLCGLISGGIAGKTPTAFVYSINPHDLRQWNYLGLLVHVGLNFQPSRWSGDLGVNWEVVNWVPLTDDEKTTRYFIIMGAEGCLDSRKYVKRTPRAQLWMSIKPCSSAADALATYAFSGIFDHGCCYAANSFWDPITAQQIVYCWITEEDLPDDLRHQQGWSGMLSIPRVAKLITLHRVRRARHSELSAITSIETQRVTQQTSTIRTLGIQPDPRLEGLRNERCKMHVDNLPLENRRDGDSLSSPHLSLITSTWEVLAEFSVSNQCSAVGMEIKHGDDMQHRTILYWEPSRETFIVQRPLPHDSRINHDPESAPHTLFTFKTLSGEEREETLQIHAFWDTSVLEVFVNERTVISTRIYLLPNQARCSRLRFFAEGKSDSPPAVLLQASGWDGLGVSQ
ncbi:glycoside hydrolase family 32 protein [Aspergillus ibericus CBS 121593]|uniref:Glycosyl hydrolase family protein n=1 Tax=Aspergillus ibericus CBS 121593 TaxID=1448316 RepID=A0A395GM45_9EURO|nr:glycosyl hydrolase family protein [Aspergillus ibericus CBS 121593]RAK96454.1 glycosyl hydrolase family protein [Aspergillus ibericus CBS 121593]